MADLYDPATDDLLVVGDEVTHNGESATITAIEQPEHDFAGCVHLKRANGSEFDCAPESFGAQWSGWGYVDGVYMGDDGREDRDAYESGGWTQDDTESMERGRDLPLRNDDGEYL